MNNLGNVLLYAHTIFIVIMVSIFFMMIVVNNDELHQYAMNRAMKTSVIITILFLLGFAFYNLISDSRTISIHVLFFGIEGLSLLTLIVYYFELREFTFSFKKNKKVGSILVILSLIIAVLTIISMLFNFKLFANPVGIIRYDELLLFIDLILIPLTMSLFPDIKKRLNREEYKKEQKKITKESTVFAKIFLGIFLGILIAYIIYIHV